MEPGDNARYVMFGMAIYNMEPIDINNVEQVESRIQEYFALCINADMKPEAASMEAREWARCFNDTDESRADKEDLRKQHRSKHKEEGCSHLKRFLLHLLLQ